MKLLWVLAVALVAQRVAFAQPQRFICDCPGEEGADPVCGVDGQVCW